MDDHDEKTETKKIWEEKVDCDIGQFLFLEKFVNIKDIRGEGAESPANADNKAADVDDAIHVVQRVLRSGDIWSEFILAWVIGGLILTENTFSQLWWLGIGKY